MYQITCDNYVLLDLRDDDLILSNPKLNLESNTCGSCSFTMHKNHPYYSNLNKMKSIINVIEDGNTIFKGRIISDELDWNNSKQVTCEGALAYFNDSIIPPFNFPDDFVIGANDNVVEVLLNWIITQHNSQVQNFQKFTLGNVTVTDTNNTIVRSSEDYMTSWECLSDKLFNSSLGGYLCIRYENNGNYIDYVSSFPLTNTQEITFGENLLDLTSGNTADETVSAVLPIGAEGLTIESIADGDLTSDLVKSGKVIYSRSAVNNYGYICSVQKWDDVTVASNLSTKAQNWLSQTGIMLSNKITVNAVDLHFSDQAIQSFRINRNVLVRSIPHDYNASYELTSLSIDLLNPQNTKITLGKSFLSLIDGNQNETNEIYNKVSETKKELISDIANESIKNKTEIIQNCNEIIQSATSEFVTQTGLNEYKETVTSKFEQTSEDFTMEFSKVTEKIEDVNGDLQEKYNERLKYIRFVEGNIVLGEEGNEITLTIEHDRITFKQNGQDVAWFSNNIMHVTETETTVSSKIGKFAFVPGANGNLSFRKVVV